MCGIAGFVDFSPNRKKEKMERLGLKMLDSLAYRGPDDCGIWLDAENGLILGHRRLSILDLTLAGHQPMHSACGRYVMSFNGEVYNFQEIKKELGDAHVAPVFRGHSDAEVMLAAISRWGVREAVERFNGMFAIALFDRSNRRLYLIRDRIGKKPLYYGRNGSVFYFASELKALRANDDFRAEIDRESLALYLRYGYVPSPCSIYKNVYKLEAGKIFVLDLNPTSNKHEDYLVYWSAKEMVLENRLHPFKGNDEEAVFKLEELLTDAVNLRMISDVSLGAFLSGGVDSSAIVALMQKLSSRPIKTFSIGFNEDEFNEAQYAKNVARHLQTEHTEFYVSPAEAMGVIPKLPELFDEPFSDSSQIPTFLVSQLAHKHVTVSLSGDGGDELFAGYPRYFLALDIRDKIKHWPNFLRKVVAKMLSVPSPRQRDAFSRVFGGILRGYGNQGSFGDKFSKIASVLEMPNEEALYLRLVSIWDNPHDLLAVNDPHTTILSDRSRWPDFSDFVQKMMFLDLVTYLPDDIMVKVDRATMGVSLESRAPYLDHRVVRFAWSLPMNMKIRQGKNKWILKQVLYKYVPAKLIERPKMGFGMPIDLWLRGPLRDWAQSLLDFRRIESEGFFNSELIRRRWAEHLSGKRNWQHCLWNILMFEAWKDRWMKSSL